MSYAAASKSSDVGIGISSWARAVIKRSPKVVSLYMVESVILFVKDRVSLFYFK